MGLLDPTPPPYDPLAWSTKPFAERARMVCEAWAMQGYGTPAGAYLFYALKLALYVGGWVAFGSLSPALGGASSIAAWWLHPSPSRRPSCGASSSRSSASAAAAGR